MLLRILGSAAGGGFPQWNCNCDGCWAARQRNGAEPRMQSSLAVRSASAPWFLVNASPDVRQQLELLRDSPPSGLRASPISGVVLTDAEIDHTAGLAVLRESREPLRVFCSPAVKRTLSEDFAVIRVLGNYCGVRWVCLSPGTAVPLCRGLGMEVFSVPGKQPIYSRVKEEDGHTFGLSFHDSGGALATYVPALGAVNTGLLERFEASDLVLIDGTFWRDDELITLGIGDRTARQMGHLPLSGPGGIMDVLSSLRRPRKVLVHINNTNPILPAGSPERRLIEQAGFEISRDGMNFEL